jgi:hypothetical protein
MAGGGSLQFSDGELLTENGERLSRPMATEGMPHIDGMSSFDLQSMQRVPSEAYLTEGGELAPGRRRSRNAR